jgi:ethanolamine permease
VFWFSALPHIDIGRWALDIAADGSPLPGGNGPLFPFGFGGVLATLPFAVWLFLAIEQVPLAAEESIEPRRDLPRGILLAFGTLVLSAVLIMVLNPSVPGLGSFALGRSGEPLLDGFRALYGDTGAVILGGIALTGLVASFHTILYAQGRQIYSLSRAGYFPTPLSLTHERFRTPHVATIAGSAAGLGVVLTVWFASGGPASDWTGVSALLLNMVVFGAMLSYIAQALSFILLRLRRPAMPRPFRSPFGVPGALVTIAIALVTLAYQMQDPTFLRILPWVAAWLALGLAWFALVARHRLILAPEEQVALSNAH